MNATGQIVPRFLDNAQKNVKFFIWLVLVNCRQNEICQVS